MHAGSREAYSSPAPSGTEPQCSQHYGPLAGTPGPGNRDLDIVKGRGQRRQAIRRKQLPCGDRTYTKRPAVASAVLASKFARYKCGIASDRREVRLSALDGLFGSRRYVHGEEPAASGVKQTNQRQPGNRQRYDDLEQREAIPRRGAISAHRLRLSFRSANRRQPPFAAVRRPG